MCRARDEGFHLPAAAVALSPWTDLALLTLSIKRTRSFLPASSAFLRSLSSIAKTSPPPEDSPRTAILRGSAPSATSAR
jgi:hypothetical protein